MNADDINLEEMSLVELRKLENRIQNSIKDAEVKARQDALADMQAAAELHGLSIDEVFGKTKKRSSSGQKPVNPPKYAHPEQPEKTWSGVGRMPKWVKEHVDQGGNLEDLAIKK